MAIKPELRSFTELHKIAKIFYEITAPRTCNVFATYPCPRPLYTPWADIAPEVKKQTVEGLKSRIEKEGLRGYLERKRPLVGSEITDEIIRTLNREKLLSIV
ncbi:hypothetical protein ES703_57211 [subsurface metagenome]